MSKLLLWGCHLNEYQNMFDIDLENKHLSILEYRCGVTAFNSQCHKQGINVVSVDDIFALGLSELEEKTNIIFKNRLWN